MIPLWLVMGDVYPSLLFLAVSVFVLNVIVTWGGKAND